MPPHMNGDPFTANVQKAEILLNIPQCTRRSCHNNETLGHNCQLEVLRCLCDLLSAPVEKMGARQPLASHFGKFPVNSHKPHSSVPTSIQDHIFVSRNAVMICLHELNVVAQTHESQRWEAEVGGSQVGGQPGLHSNSLSQKTQEQNRTDQIKKAIAPQHCEGSLLDE